MNYSILCYTYIYLHIFYNLVTKYGNLSIFWYKFTVFVWLNWFRFKPERQPDGYVHLSDVLVGPETQMNLFCVGKSL